MPSSFNYFRQAIYMLICKSLNTRKKKKKIRVSLRIQWYKTYLRRVSCIKATHVNLLAILLNYPLNLSDRNLNDCLCDHRLFKVLSHR